MTDRVVFKTVSYDVAGLLSFIDIGDIGLPDIQRPFVWTPAKVRDLFDSMYRGFPVGYLLFWANANVNGARPIGVDEKGHSVPRFLIVDGQQRLTSLFAVFKGKAVLDQDYRETRINIAFRPTDGKFEVADAAVVRDPEFVANISDIWASGKSSHRLVKEFLERLRLSRAVSDEEEERVSHNLDRLFDIQRYPFTALEVSPAVDEEQVADIFVRINSEGVKLNQADFILTLLSVFWDDGRRGLEQFSRSARIPPGRGAGPSPYNHFITPSPDQLLRVSIALGFGRGRLKSVYQVLRGKDVETDTFSPARREEQFARLREAQTVLLNLTHWHQFFGSLVGAGFRSGELVSSENALLYSYSLYLIGKTRYRVAERVLQRLLGRWFYAVTLSGRYTGSPETVMDGDLNRVKDLTSAEAFVETLERIVNDTLTGDFWKIGVPNLLETSAARSPAMSAYLAAQNLLGAPVLFSHKKISDLLDPTVSQPKRSLERHHLFPRAWLEGQGVSDLKHINQAANMAFLEWPENIEISDSPPSEYVPAMRARFEESAWKQMHRLHALPDGWEGMSYDEFLRVRRRLMADVIRKGFERIGAVQLDAYTPPVEAPPSNGLLAEDEEDDEGDNAKQERQALLQGFWGELLSRARPKTHLHSGRSTSKLHWLSASAGLRGMSLIYIAWPHETAVELYIDRGKESAPENKAIFDRLMGQREAIEECFGASMLWERMENHRASRIRFKSAAGGYRDKSRWASIQDAMIEAMIRFEAAFRPSIDALPR